VGSSGKSILENPIFYRLNLQPVAMPGLKPPIYGAARAFDSFCCRASK
jgi:hypothetical protein